MFLAELNVDGQTSQSSSAWLAIVAMTTVNMTTMHLILEWTATSSLISVSILRKKDKTAISLTLYTNWNIMSRCLFRMFSISFKRFSIDIPWISYSVYCSRNNRILYWRSLRNKKLFGNFKDLLIYFLSSKCFMNELAASLLKVNGYWSSKTLCLKLPKHVALKRSHVVWNILLCVMVVNASVTQIFRPWYLDWKL